MTEEEIKGYAKWFGNMCDHDEIIEKISDIKEDLIYRCIENVIEELNKIIYSMEEELEVAKELDLQEEVEQLNLTINTLHEFLDAEKSELSGENLNEEELTPKQIVFAKSDAGNFYITSDIKKIKYSKEVYDRIKSVFDFIQSGRKPNNQTFAKKLNNNKSCKNIIEYKNYQVRVYTKNLVDNVVCIIGIRIKKDNNPKSIITYLNQRNKQVEQSHTIENMTEMIKNGQKEELLEESKEELNLIMNILQNKEFTESVKTNEENYDEEVDVENEIIETFEEKPLIENETKDSMADIPTEWIKAYEVAKIVFEDKGTINVRSSYKSGVFEFGKWIKRQKKDKDEGLLSNKQIELLEELGIRWYTKDVSESSKATIAPKIIAEKPIVKNKLEQRWMNSYNLAKNYYEQYGDLMIPTHYKDPETKIKLGVWINNQRQAYKNGKMPEHRIKLLEEIGMIWSVRSYKKEIEDKPKIEKNQQFEEIEILDLYPEEKQIEDNNTENCETKIHIEEENSDSYDIQFEINEETVENVEMPVGITTENTKDSLISQISTSLDSCDVDTLYEIQRIIKKFTVQNALTSEINQVYEGLLKMSSDELNEFAIQLENIELPRYKGKK